MDWDTIRRIAERGLIQAEEKWDSENIDIFNHLLSELHYLKPMERLILTDCDGVLLQWNYAFDLFMHERGFPLVGTGFDNYGIAKRYGISEQNSSNLVQEFNNSDLIRMLSPYADARIYVPKLAYQGFRFVVISSLSKTQSAKKNRTHNLVSVFGDVFDDVICLDTRASKAEVLLPWKDSGLFFIEDHQVNAVVGARLGLNSVLVDQAYNTHKRDDDSMYTRTSRGTPWKDIYNMVMEAYN